MSRIDADYARRLENFRKRRIAEMRKIVEKEVGQTKEEKSKTAKPKKKTKED